MTRRPSRPGSQTRTPTSGPGRGAPGHRPRKRLGQHFLAAPWAQKIVGAIQPQPGDVFLEIGPGSGALTLPLAATGVPVLAIEIDRDLVAHLVERVPSNVTVMSGDVLTTDVLAFLKGLQPQRPPGPTAAPASRRYRIAGNLPYYLASPIMFRLIEWHRQHGLFADATVMVQREVADRMVAAPGGKEYGVLTVMLAMHARITRLLNLPPGAFTPPPRVHSTVVRLEFGPPLVRVRDEVMFERLVKALFSQRRKTLANALKRFDPRGAAVLAQAGIDGRRRPETLQVTELARLAELLSPAGTGPVL